MPCRYPAFSDYNMPLMRSMWSAIFNPFSVSLIVLILPCFSKLTRFDRCISCNILTTWEYVQSTSFAKMDPYLFLLPLFNATNIIAGFFLKNTSNISFDRLAITYSP